MNRHLTAGNFVPLASVAPKASDGPRRDVGDYPKALPFLTWGSLSSHPVAKDWLIKGIFATGETSAWIGPPGSLKSMLLTEAAISVASGSGWRGRRSRRPAGVMYVAFERADLVRRRLKAHQMRDGSPAGPVAVVSDVFNLMDPDSVDVLADTIRKASADMGTPVELVIIDTLAKAIAAGNGDEDKARDQGAVFANLQRLKSRVPVHVALIGHTGKDETRGARGSSALLGDVDLMVSISGGEGSVKTATITKANDTAEGALFSFKAQSFHLGMDEDGDAIEVGILDADLIEPMASTGGRKDTLPRGARIMREALAEAIHDHGRAPPVSSPAPPGTKAVTISEWRARAYQRGLAASDEPKAKQVAFRRGRDALNASHAIGIWEDWVWLGGNT